jgi:hypothetical protein
VLGSGHPLTRALEASRRAVHQLAVAGAVLVGAGTAAAAGGAVAPSLLIAAGIAVIGFGCRLALLADQTRLEARNAVIDGRDRVQLPSVRAECRRLADPLVHERLAQWVQALGNPRDADTPAGRWTGAAVREVGPQLCEIALLLGTGHTGIRGVAMLERLLSNGAAPLYGDDPRVLAEELGRIRYHLSAGR